MNTFDPRECARTVKDASEQCQTIPLDRGSVAGAVRIIHENVSRAEARLEGT